MPSLAKTGDVINLSFTSSDPINPPAVTIASHTVTATAGSGNSFVASYTMTNADASGNIAFSINFSNTSGIQGAQVTATTDGTAVSFDKTAPSVISIKRQSPLTENTSAASGIYRAIFSEKITGADAADFMLAVVSGSVNGTLTSGAISPVGSDGTTYDITVSSVAGDGVLRLDLKNSATGITDAAGNEIASGFGSGETYTIVPVVIPGGFTSVTPLTPVDLSQPTKDKPQAKVWNYAGKWWCVLSVTAGTKVYRLDGTSWTDILLLNHKSSKPDCRMVGDMVHILCYKGANNNSLMYSLKYDAATNTYKLWTARPAGTSLVFPAGSETATIAVDGTGRMWAASDGATDITVWYSDAPYTSWSAPVTIATGIKSDDICSIIAMPGQNKIGVFWSNQVTKRFGFRTHADGADPAVWSADEIPASQSAINNVGYGMADDHMNLKVASDGTIYCAAKTGYNKDGYAKVILLVRRPSGVWDNQYTVTMNPEGTQPIVLLNETTGKLRMVYASLENGGDILYRESDISNISFGPARTLITSPGILYDYTASSHENFSSEIVILATDLSSTPQRAVGLIATDIGNGNKIAGKIGLESRLTLNDNNQQTIFKAYPNPFGTSAIVSFTLPDAGMYSITLYDVKGTRQTMIKQGWAGAGINNTVQLDGSSLASGIYMIKLLTAKSSHVIKVMVKK